MTRLRLKGISITKRSQSAKMEEGQYLAQGMNNNTIGVSRDTSISAQHK
jgi:hypothetical protein